MSNVLIVAAHPDDEVLGCAGAIQYHHSIGDRVTVLIMTFDYQGRYPNDHRKLMDDITKSRSHLKYHNLNIKNYQDQGLDLVRLIDLTKEIENVIKSDQIDTVYTHHYGDINKDHRICYEATITACRPTPTCTVERLLAYWVPSSSEWMSYDDNNAFKSNYLIELNKNRLQQKILAMQAYESEVRQYPHPRSDKGIRLYAETFGIKFGHVAVEPFQLLYDRKSR